MEKPDEDSLEYVGVDGRIMLIWILNGIGGHITCRCGLGYGRVRDVVGTVLNIWVGAIKCGEFLD